MRHYINGFVYYSTSPQTNILVLAAAFTRGLVEPGVAMNTQPRYLNLYTSSKGLPLIRSDW